MENFEIREPIESIQGAVETITERGDITEVIEYLRAHKDEVVEFCQQVTEAYSKDDPSGVIKIGLIIEKLL